MRLAEAVAHYLTNRRQDGAPLVTTEITLRLFCKHCGDIDIERVTAELVSSFSNDAKCLPVTRVSNFGRVNCFLEHCIVRGLLPALSLRCPPQPSDQPGYYIYSAQELDALLKATELCQSRARAFDAKTFRRLILLLYGTGTTLHEVLDLKWSSVNLRTRLITIDKSIRRASRVLPIGADLLSYLTQWRAQDALPSTDNFILRRRNGNAVSPGNLQPRFVRLCKLAGLQARRDGRVPRLRDLRYTFAVHRLHHWIGRGDDLNRLIPALSTYMGYQSLMAAEKFLAYVPDRFKRDLQKLSAIKGKPWASDLNLMAFLSSL